MASDFLSMTVGEVLNLYKEKYYEQTGQPLRLGSEDLAAASVHTYVYGVLMNAINYAFQNSVLSGASGEWLDAIGETWNVSRPAATKASVMMHIKSLQAVTLAAGSLRVADAAGHIFTNKEAVSLVVGDVGAYASCAAENTGSDYNDIEIDAINILVEPENIGIYSVGNTTVSGGGLDEASDDEEGDEIYREYIRTQRKTPLVGASSASYLAKVWATEPNRIYDAYVIQSGDSDYTAGKVKIRVIPRNSDYMADVLVNLQEACAASDFRAIGDLVEVSTASETSLNPWLAGFRVVYPLKFKGLAETHLNNVVSEYQTYLKQGFNRPFSEAELVKRLTTIDEDGVYALEANIASGDPNPLRVVPNAGYVLLLANLTAFYYSISYE